MILLAATEYFSGGFEFYLTVLVLAALILALYLWGNSHHKKEGRAEILQRTYKTMSREILKKIPDDELVDAVAANLLAKLDNQNPDAYKSITILSRGRCAVYCIWMSCHELKSEGLPSYIKSPSRRFFDLTADGFELIGANDCAKLFRQVKSFDPFDEEKLLLLQEKILDAISREQPLNLCRDYIRTNPDEFCDIFPSDHAGGGNSEYDTFAE